MHAKTFRRGIAILVAAGFAGCAGQPGTPISPSQGMATRIEASSPCKIKGIWYFKGPCLRVSMPATGVKVSLPQYKGLSLSLDFPKNSTTKSVPFIIGMGTGSDDILGKTFGRKFVDYGSMPCFKSLKPGAPEVPCPQGEGFLYALIYSSTQTPIAFKSVPAITITDAGQFPGTKKCQVISVGFLGSSPVAWIVYPIYATPRNGELSFPAAHRSFTVGPSDSDPSGYQVLGFICV